MKKFFLLGSTGILFFVIGCSGNSQQTASTSAPAVAQAPDVLAAAPPAAKEISLPVPSAGSSKHPAWQSEKVKDPFSDGVGLKTTSLDGKFDLVVLQEGRQAFLSFARHGQWEAVHNRPSKGKLVVLRAKFEDGSEKHIQWDELGFGTKNLYSVLWSYPAPRDDAPSAASAGSQQSSFGGDQLLVQDMAKHKTMLLEIEPGLTAQFDLTGLAHEMEKARPLKAEAILAAQQDIQ